VVIAHWLPKSDPDDWSLRRRSSLLKPTKDGKSADQNWIVHQDLLDGVKLKMLANVCDDRGTVCEIFRFDWKISDEPLVHVFQTSTYPGRVKAWLVHRRHTDRLFVATGMLQIALFDDRPESPTRGRINEFFLGELRRGVLVVPPGIYHGWKNIGQTESIVISMPTESYDYDDPDVFRVDPHNGGVPYSWTARDR
jgi:dTDP-4-dehydrorhamnose 3,5-epimerase